MVFIVYGLPFVGKRQFGRLLARHYNCRCLSTSETRNKWIMSPTYLLSEKRAVYLSLLQEAAEAMERKENLVICGCFHKEEFRHDFRELGKAMEVPIVWVQYQLHENGKVDHETLEMTTKDAELNTIRNKVAGSFSPVTKEYPEVIVDTNCKIDTAIARIDQFIDGNEIGV